MVAAMAETKPMREFFCSCGRFLFRASLSPGSSVQLRCKSCGQNMTVYIPDDDTEE